MWWTLAIAAAALLLGLAYYGLRAYLKLRGTRLITCPETSHPEAVEVDAGHAALTGAIGEPELRLSSCTRWPERRDCGQECLRQIEAAPEDCLVKNILTRWYAGKSCVYCGKPLGEINWLDHRPGLLTPDQKSVEWFEVRPETLPGVLATHRPVCWNCHISMSFRREHPDLVVDRGARHAPSGRS